MDWLRLVVFWVGVTLNLAGAACAALALVRAHSRYGTGDLAPIVVRPWRWARGLINTLKRRHRQPERPRVPSGGFSGTGTLTASAEGYKGHDPAAPIEEQVEWLVSRVEGLRRRAETDRQAHNEALAGVRDELSEHHRQTAARLDDLWETAKEIGAGTAPLQLRGLLLVAVGTLLTAVASVPG